MSRENVVQFTKKRPLPGESKEHGAPKKRKVSDGTLELGYVPWISALRVVAFDELEPTADSITGKSNRGPAIVMFEILGIFSIMGILTCFLFASAQLGTSTESPLPITETPPAGRAQGPVSPHGVANYQPSFGHFLPTQYPGMTHFYHSYAPQVYPTQPTPMFPDGRAYPRHGEGVVPPPHISAPPILHSQPNSSGSSASSSTFSAFSPSGTNPNSQLRYEIPASFYQ